MKLTACLFSLPLPCWVSSPFLHIWGGRRHLVGGGPCSLKGEASCRRVDESLPPSADFLLERASMEMQSRKCLLAELWRQRCVPPASWASLCLLSGQPGPLLSSLKGLLLKNPFGPQFLAGFHRKYIHVSLLGPACLPAVTDSSMAPTLMPALPLRCPFLVTREPGESTGSPSLSLPQYSKLKSGVLHDLPLGAEHRSKIPVSFKAEERCQRLGFSSGSLPDSRGVDEWGLPLVEGCWPFLLAGTRWCSFL